MRSCRLLLVPAVFLPLAACSGLPEFEEPLPEVRSQPLSKQSAPVSFERLRIALRPGAKVGGYAYRLGACYPHRQDIYWDEEPLKSVESAWKPAANRVLRDIGFTTPEDNDGVFADLGADRRHARYLFGAIVRDVNIRACEAVDMATGEPAERESGRARVTVDWSVYSTRKRAVVHRETLRGEGVLRRARRKGLALMVERALKDSLIRFTADRELRRRLAETRRKRQAPRSAASRPPRLERTSDLSDMDVRDQAERLRNAVVIVETGLAHGSGFYITPELILSNAHVVGGEPVVRVQLLNGEARDARVLRKHVPRDIALLRTEPVSIRPLPLRRRPIRGAETVFAIGAPLDRALAASITQGTVSARNRRNRNGLPLIQADVDVQPGNSGGPLLDAKGNVVGVSVSGYGKRSIGLNFFVPIDDALARLGLREGG